MAVKNTLGGNPQRQVVGDNVRHILYGPVEDGLFEVPKEGFTAKDEVEWAKKRMDSVRIASYADSTCGLPNTYDPMGAYLCGGCSDGSSSPCNKFVGKSECLIRIQPLASPTTESCAYWEIKNAGDSEARYCPKGRLDDKRIAFGSTKNPDGFGCIRCEYGQQLMPSPDSEGRNRWCALKGHPVEDNSCCADNEPEELDEDEQ